MTYLFSCRIWLALGLLLAMSAAPGGAFADTVIQKVANKSLAGVAYARLRNLTYDQCAERCLKDTRCVAVEHHRGGAANLRSSNCALFSSISKSSESVNTDVGYKRVSTAAANGNPQTRRSARTGTPREGADTSIGQAYKAPSPRRLETETTTPRAPGSAPTVALPRPAAAPPPPPPPVVAAPAPRASSRDVAEAEARRAEEGARRQAAEISREPDERRRAEEASRQRAAEAARQPDAAPRPVTRSVRPPSAASAPPPAAAPPPATDEKFHIVPVFYGTDRNQIKQEGRIGYANDRAKRLEVGRALVSVPLNHKVPNIERPRAWTIPYVGTIQLEREDPSKHFTVRELKTLTKAELIALVRQRLGASQTFKNQSIVFIHGYNMGFDHALYRTAQISYDLQFDGAAFAYSWPSGGGLSSYIYDRDSAQGAERYLYEFLQMVQNETGSTHINIIAHSMGNQMLLQVLRSLKLRSPDTISRINQIILASPDVDRDAFESIATEITGIARGITLYAAANDRALDASRIVAGNKPRAGDVPEEGPVIVSGIDTIDITRVSTGYLALHHSGYAESSELLTDIGQIIRAGTRPWSLRLKAYKPVNVSAGTYWRYEQ